MKRRRMLLLVQAFELQGTLVFCGVGRSGSEYAGQSTISVETTSRQILYVVPTGPNSDWIFAERNSRDFRLSIWRPNTKPTLYLTRYTSDIEFGDTHRPLKSYDDVED